jgi:alpha-beta hydrolase superfamily lysophospholipase
MTGRHRISFSVAGTECIGYVYRGRGAGAANLQPCIVMAHGFSGTQEGALAATARDFAAAGFVVLTFDYRSFGESGGDPRQVIDMASQLEDWRAALATARRLADIDPHRLVVWVPRSAAIRRHVLDDQLRFLERVLGDRRSR